jgi:hypothetical protein
MLPSWVSSWCYQQMLRLGWKEIARYKYYNLFGLIVSNEGKKFYNIDTKAQCYKTFLSVIYEFLY